MESKIKIKDITICLHCGCDRGVVFSQMEELAPLEEKYNITWNNRIDRYPLAYPSYSELINDSINTSNTEFIILINDRCTPLAEHAEKIIGHLESGYACSLMYNVAFMGLSKQLIREIGWWDERYLNGGWEDRDWVFRLKAADLALYESQEGLYDYSWKSPLQVEDRCALSGPFFEKKWTIDNQSVTRNLEEEDYSEKYKNLGENNIELRKTWNKWKDSVLGIDYDKPNSGPPGSAWIQNKIVK